MMKRRTLASSALGLALSLLAPWASADNYPSQPIRFAVNVAPGGSTDTVARLVAKYMAEHLKQSIVVENRAGADGLVGVRAVQGAKPDGYTILVATGTYLVQPLIKRDANYDALKEFVGVGLVARAPLLMVVGGEQPDKTFADFVARAKSKPESINYASAGVGTLSHLPYALMLQDLGIDLQHVPYKGNGAAFADVAGNRVTSVMTAYSSALSYMQGGKMRPLAVTSSKRLPILPDVPTIAEAGIPGYSFYTWYGLFAPKGTPDEVVKKLSDALLAAQKHPEVGARLTAEGSEVTPYSPAEFASFLRQENSRLEKLVKTLGLAKE